MGDLLKRLPAQAASAAFFFDQFVFVQFVSSPMTDRRTALLFVFLFMLPWSLHSGKRLCPRCSLRLKCCFFLHFPACFLKQMSFAFMFTSGISGSTRSAKQCFTRAVEPWRCWCSGRLCPTSGSWPGAQRARLES